MKTLLVYSGTDAGFQNFEAVPPLGLVALYSALPEGVRSNTTFLDGNLVTGKYISDWIASNRPDVVGISSLTFGYQSAIKIGEAAQSVGATVVLGGRHATDVLPNILSRMKTGDRPFDYLVSGEGEIIFRDLVMSIYKGQAPSSPNLFSRETESIAIIPERKLGLDTDFPILDYSLLVGPSSPEEYMKRLGRIGILQDVKVSMPIISQRGCAYMTERSHCKFCSIPQVNPKLPPEVFEYSLENLLKETGADHVWITEGDFTASINHVKTIKDRIKTVKGRTNNDFVIYCFARSDDLLRKDMIRTLYDAGVRAVFIGYEHGNDEMLAKMHKNTTREQNIEATQRLADAGIEVTCAGIVLGTPPETESTLDDAISFAYDLSKIGNVRSIFASPLYPFPGAPYWGEFLDAVTQYDSRLGAKIRGADILKEERLVTLLQDVAHLMPGGAKKRPSFKRILQAKEDISDMLGKGIQFTKSF